MQVLAANILVRILLPCLSNSLDKNTKIMSMFVLFSLLFRHVECLAVFENGGTFHKSSQNVFSQFFKGTTIKEHFGNK